MNPDQIRELLKDCIHSDNDIEFVGFPNPKQGWYAMGKGAETRVESEVRAAKFFLWFCEYLDTQLSKIDHDLFDAGVQIEGEEHEDEHDKHALRIRRRRTALVIGHGDFMSLVMKRIVSGYGHFVETKGISHRKCYFVFSKISVDSLPIQALTHNKYICMGCITDYWV